MSESAVETESVLPPAFSTLDRCDRCGAQAKLRAMLPAGMLLFCGHHGREYFADLAHAGALIESEL